MIHKMIFALTLALLLGLLTGVGLAGWPLPAYATHTTDNKPLADLALLPPQANNDTVTIPEDSGQVINVLSNDSDPESDALSLVAVGAAQHGTTLMQGNSAVYTAALNFAGTDSFTYTASDGSLTSTGRVTVTVTPVNDKPIVGTAEVLYDGALGGTPVSQGFFVYTALPPQGASETASSGVTALTTTLLGNGTYAGYINNPVLTPILNRGRGYTLRFWAQVLTENHAGSDKNGDGVDDRAGFSVIVISNDGLRGIELGFWTNRIWAQNGGAPVNSGGTLFTQGESVAFDTTAALTPYELTVLDEAYTLTAGNTVILSGSLRDYSALPDGPLDVYETPNFIFFGDDTTSASASFKLGEIAVITKTNPPGRSVDTGVELVLDGLGIMDMDAGVQTVVATMTVQTGVLTLTTSAPGGLSAGQISGNGSAVVGITGTVGQINRTLAFSPGLIYRSNDNFYGQDKMFIKVDDQGHTGGGTEIQQRNFSIFVIGPNANYLPNIFNEN